MPDEIKQCQAPLMKEEGAVDLSRNLICDCEVLLYRCGET